jgi:hypothetical protein
LENIMGTAVNRFGFSTLNMSSVPLTAGQSATGIFLSAEGVQSVYVTNAANTQVSLPNPALCDGQSRTIFAGGNFTVQVLQYNTATTHGATPVALPGPAGSNAIDGKLTRLTSTTTSVAGPPITTAGGVGTPNYAQATYYCDGSTWFLAGFVANPIFTT